MTRPIARLTKAFAWGALTLILVAVIGFALLSTSFAERRVRGLLESYALTATGTTLTIDQLEIRPWRREALLRGVTARLAGADDAGIYQLATASVGVQVDRSGRLRLTLEAPVLSFRFGSGEAERATGPSLGEQLERARLESVVAAHGAVHLLAPDGAAVAHLDNVSLGFQRAASDRFEVSGEGEVTVSVAEGRTLEAGTLRLRGEIAGPEIRLAQAKLERAGADLSASGTLRESPTLDGAIESEFHLAAEVVRELFPELRATGEIDGTARLVLGPEGLSVEADFRGAGLSWDAYGPLDAGGLLRLAGRRLDLHDGSLAGYGGRADVTAGWDLDSERQDLAVAWTGVDLGELLADAAMAELPVDARASGEAHLSTVGFAAEAASGGARVTLDGRVRRTGTPLQATARARFDAGDVDVEQSRVEVGPGQLDAAGRVSRDGDVDGTFRFAWSDLSRLEDAAVLAAVPPPQVALGGSIAATGRIAGEIDDPRFTATVERQTLDIAGEPVAIGAEASGDRRSLTLQHVDAEAGGGHLRLGGVIGWSGERALALRLEVEAVDLCTLVVAASAPACGVLDASGELTGSLSAPRFALHGQVSALRSRRSDDLTAEPGLLRFSARGEGGRVEVEELRGLLDGGAVEGAGSYDRRTGEIEGRLRVADLPVATLLPAGDGWDEVDGTLDVESTFAGSASSPRGSARVALHDLSIDGRPLPDVDATATAGGGGDLEIEARSGRDAPFLTARVELERPFQFQANVDLGALPAAAVAGLLSGLPRRLDDPVLAGRVAIDGALLDSSALHARGEIERLEAHYGGLLVSAQPFTLAGDAEGLRIESLRLVSDEGPSWSRERCRSAVTASSTCAPPATCRSGFCRRPSCRSRASSASSFRSAGGGSRRRRSARRAPAA